MDEDDNVREAALPALRRLLGPASDDAFVAALQRPDYQLLRTAARELKGSAPSPPLAGALAAALARVTAEKKETSRDIADGAHRAARRARDSQRCRWLRPAAARLRSGRGGGRRGPAATMDG